MSLGEAHGDGDASELAGILLDGIGVAREGGVADVRVESRAAARANEIGAAWAVGGGHGGVGVAGGGGWMEEEECG